MVRGVGGPTVAGGGGVKSGGCGSGMRTCLDLSLAPLSCFSLPPSFPASSTSLLLPSQSNPALPIPPSPCPFLSPPPPHLPPCRGTHALLSPSFSGLRDHRPPSRSPPSPSLPPSLLLPLHNLASSSCPSPAPPPSLTLPSLILDSGNFLPHSPRGPPLHDDETPTHM